MECTVNMEMCSGVNIGIMTRKLENSTYIANIIMTTVDNYGRYRPLAPLSGPLTDPHFVEKTSSYSLHHEKYEMWPVC
jgi:hypothetical protein